MTIKSIDKNVEDENIIFCAIEMIEKIQTKITLKRGNTSINTCDFSKSYILIASIRQQIQDKLKQ